MKIDIITVGKIKEGYLKEGIAEYLKRLKPFVKINLIEVADEPHKNNVLDVLRTEEKRIEKHVKKDSFFIVLDIKGKMFSSEKLAEFFQDLMLSAVSNVTILIGGSLGVSKDLTERADLRLSFSKLTFPHQLMKIILMEQLYRIFKIINNEPYHK